MENFKCNGVSIEFVPEKVDELCDSSAILNDLDALKQRMATEGYLFFRALIDPVTVHEARREILLKYAIVGEIDAIHYPATEAIRQEHSFIDQVNLLAFTESIRTGKAYENVVLAPPLIDFYERFLGGSVHCFDFKWPRFVRPGENTGLHSDIVYVGRGSRNLWSSWIPLGDVPKIEGSLILLERSHKAASLSDYWEKDADIDKVGWLADDPVELQQRLGGRWLTTDFKAGDVLCFDVRLVHASLDNNSPIGRCRLTSDTRYQLRSEALDDRWNGDIQNPHGGGQKVFLPGLGRSNNNKDFEEEWKPVDDYGRLPHQLHAN